MTFDLEQVVARDLWPLDPEVVFLNHGSFGCCPKPVLEFREETMRRLEAEPVQFYVRQLESELDAAAAALALFVGADPEDLVPVANATTGVNAVLRSLAWEPDDEILITDHGYNACNNAARFVAKRAGARVVVAKVPFPVSGTAEVEEAIMGCVTNRTRLAVLDHITSPTGLVYPMERLVRKLRERGVETLVDGAHAPGMLPLDINALGAAFYTGNCHKWICAPKTTGFLVVRRDWQESIRPLTISHGANSTRTDRSRFRIEFDWQGTWDASAFLSVPEALRVVGSLLPGGWPGVMRRNRELALAARTILCEALGIDPPCPDDMIGSLAAIPLPDGDGTPSSSPLHVDPLSLRLFDEHRIEVPVPPWPAPPRRLLRVSAQLYNRLEDYRRLAEAVKTSIPSA